MGLFSLRSMFIVKLTLVTWKATFQTIYGGRHAWKLLRDIIPFLDSFITQNASDRDLLVRQLKEYGTPILNYTGGNSIMCEPLNITPEMKQLGITSRLDQEFEAPPVVKMF
ncbi:hypothetical protein ZWY2020_002506 [Hordeum vulgare]|nr:hypothetical protein ZWY2020_002506 [Hordeum vulgare]